MNIYMKLNAARMTLQGMSLKKSGLNKFAGYQYFELADFLPAIHKIFSEVGLCGYISFDPSSATLTIIDTEKPEDKIVICSPMSTAALKGCHEVQNLGAVETYIRRYLWVTAMEIVEHDALDSSQGVSVEDVTNQLREAAKKGEQALNEAIKAANQAMLKNIPNETKLEIRQIAKENTNG